MHRIRSRITTRLVALGAALAAAATFSSSSGARTLVECSSEQSPTSQMACGRTNLHRGITTLRFLHNHRSAGTRKSRRSVRRGGKFLVRYGRKHIARARARMLPPHYSAWLCIHSYEGAWNDPGAPFYGGLQMDWGFMRTYGGHLLRTKGTADHWTPLEQMWVAERAHRSGRGFYPWPNTARYCGLI